MPLKSLCTVVVLTVTLLIGLSGCSGGGPGPVLPDIIGTDVENTSLSGGQALSDEDYDGNRFSWGLWLMHVNADHTAIEPEPVRDASMHLNVLGYLQPAGNQYLKITNVSMSQNNTLLVNIQLIHPFKNNKNLTGFDVRGIAILPAVKIFPSSIIDDVDGDPAQLYASRWLLNADGYTTLWNRWTAPAVQPPKVIGYIKGKLATPNEYFIEGNLHGYRMFWTDPMRHVFQSNQAATRTYEFDFPPGPLSFAYSVDACWHKADNLPVTDIWNDFPLSANSEEPYNISVSIVANSITKIAGAATIEFDVFDWRDASTFSNIYIEAPDLFFGKMDPGTPVLLDANTARYTVVVPNAKGNAVTANGGSDLLIAVEDVENSTVTPDLTAYEITKIPVVDVAGFWRDRDGDGNWLHVPLAAPLIEPFSLSTGHADIAVISKPDPNYDFYGGAPEILLFDDNGAAPSPARFIVYNRTLNASNVKSGYPFDSTPPSWILPPTCMDTTVGGWLGVGSASIYNTGTYKISNLLNMFNRGGIYGASWHTGTNAGGSPYLETIRDVTAGMGNITGDPVYGLFAYESGSLPAEAHILNVSAPYINTSTPNTFRCSLPMSNTGYVPGQIYYLAERLRCGIDSDPVGLDPLHQAFYVVESNPTVGTSEIEAFDINFSALPITSKWTLTDAQIKAEFPGAYAVDCEVVPSKTNKVTLIGTQTAPYNWLAVLMTDGNEYWLAFYDPLNPTPANPGNNIYKSIYRTDPVPLLVGTNPVVPVAMDVDHQYFEVYVLCEDQTDIKYYASVFEFFY